MIPTVRCHVHFFLCTPFGYEQITARNFTSITNNSVILVRFSKDQACSLGKNSYTFQGYHSNTGARTIGKVFQRSVEDDESNMDTQKWTLLR